MKSRNESEVENGFEEREAPRKEAGFEWAAEPTEVILFVPTIYYMAGVSALIVIFSSIYWGVVSSKCWDCFVWSTIATLFIGLIIFLPEYFSNIINFAVNFCVWIGFCVYTIYLSIHYGTTVKKLVHFNGTNKEGVDEAHRIINAAIALNVINCLLSLIVIVLMSRMTFYYYKNR